MSETETLRPAPWITRDSAFFWEAAKDEQLVGQRCGDCGALRAPPRPMCPHCNSLASETQRLSGRGSVHTWVIPRYPPIPGFEGTHIVAIIELEEGLRMISNVCGIDYDDIFADMPVEVFFEDTQDGYKIPLFRPAAA